MGDWIDTTIGEQATLQRGIDITNTDRLGIACGAVAAHRARFVRAAID
jgi:hypothetical protein